MWLFDVLKSIEFLTFDVEKLLFKLVFTLYIILKFEFIFGITWLIELDPYSFNLVDILWFIDDNLESLNILSPLYDDGLLIPLLSLH